VAPFNPPAGPSKAPALPSVYTLSSTSPLKTRVEAGENRLILELKSSEKPAAPQPKPAK
jgi:hypothetical protein